MITETTAKQTAQWATDAATLDMNFQRGERLAFRAIESAARGDHAKANADMQLAGSQLTEGRELLRRLLAGLGAAGILSAAPGASTVSPIAIDELDTPDTRELLATLEKAQQIAERIDAARGRSLVDAIPLQPGESAGTDLAETISLLALRVRQEVHGASSPHE